MTFNKKQFDEAIVEYAEEYNKTYSNIVVPPATPKEESKIKKIGGMTDEEYAEFMSGYHGGIGAD